MWVYHIGEIMMGLFVLLILAHLAIHFLPKWLSKDKKTKVDKQVSSAAMEGLSAEQGVRPADKQLD